MLREKAGFGVVGLSAPSEGDGSVLLGAAVSPSSDFLGPGLAPTPRLNAIVCPSGRLKTQHILISNSPTRLSASSRSWPRPRSRTAQFLSGSASGPATPSGTTPREGTGARLASVSKQLVPQTSFNDVASLSTWSTMTVGYQRDTIFDGREGMWHIRWIAIQSSDEHQSFHFRCFSRDHLYDITHKQRPRWTIFAWSTVDCLPGFRLHPGATTDPRGFSLQLPMVGAGLLSSSVFR
ncbi:hypothetical protein M8818_002641 [Zalaria obscura]|uniref:Uncharacterized protein n=1 Tax=Zalaria obscura TaxID=2024903 RepID=A0ACC3SKV8_9PEZI